MKRTKLLTTVRKILDVLIGNQLLKAKRWENVQVFYDDLTLAEKLVLLVSLLEEKTNKEIAKLIGEIQDKEKIANVLLKALKDELGSSLKKVLLNRNIIELIKVNLFVVVKEETQEIFDEEVKRQFEKAQTLKKFLRKDNKVAKQDFFTLIEL